MSGIKAGTLPPSDPPVEEFGFGHGSTCAKVEKPRTKQPFNAKGAIDAKGSQTQRAHPASFAFWAVMPGACASLAPLAPLALIRNPAGAKCPNAPKTAKNLAFFVKNHKNREFPRKIRKNCHFQPIFPLFSPHSAPQPLSPTPIIPKKMIHL
ncbi:MAG: hypothetical protein KBC66_07440 [Kiritimatiellae bacterium]|jgi:hypothetical protein|nr:hypothetical protein [Kiritimatiellia bacterium]NLD89456.1 hypothetical protein [Lentisphaerota bacterium]HPC20742.1 hypothetical protein [Kiritimatiellia bacterium]HQN80317.1 hypothetical protein [Kiritimatiellia bacterium]